MPATIAASAWATLNASVKCDGFPAPPDATTGTETASEISRVTVSSNPARVPSASTLLTTISPAPSPTARFAHSTASIPVRSRKPRVVTSYPLGHAALSLRTGSIPSTMHCAPNSRAPSRMISGVRTASELTLTFSAPARMTRSMSATDVMPPPTANGMRIVRATASTMPMSIGRCSADAVMS